MARDYLFYFRWVPIRTVGLFLDVHVNKYGGQKANDKIITEKVQRKFRLL